MLLSIAVHGAVLVAVLGVGVYVEPHERAMPAKLQMSSQEAVVAASTPAVASPPVAAEAPIDELLLVDVEVVEAEARDEPEAAPERTLRGTAAQRDARVASFGRLRVRPAPVEAVAAEPAPAEPQTEQPPSEPAEPAPAAPVADAAAPFVAAERVDARPPVYPQRERRLRREGVVVLLVAIAADGRVTGVELVRASRWSALDQAALRAARDWRFEPAREGEVPVASELEVEVAFELRS